MKIIFMFMSISLCFSCFAQNYSVTFWKDAPGGKPVGIPDYQPCPVLTFPIGTNTSVLPGATLMTKAQFLNCLATNAPAFRAYLDTKDQTEQDSKQVNLKALNDLFEDFMAYELFCRVSNPTPAQVSLQVRKLNGAMIRLKPVLKELYRGDD